MPRKIPLGVPASHLVGGGAGRALVAARPWRGLLAGFYVETEIEYPLTVFSKPPERDADGKRNERSRLWRVQLLLIRRERLALRAIDGALGPVLRIAPRRRTRTFEFDGRLAVGFVEGEGFVNSGLDGSRTVNLPQRRAKDVAHLRPDARVKRLENRPAAGAIQEAQNISDLFYWRESGTSLVPENALEPVGPSDESRPNHAEGY